MTRGDIMLQGQEDNEAIVLNVLKRPESIPLEDVVSLLPEMSWNRVFAIIDELSRRGKIALRRRGFDYELAAR
jgi:hypothetical protein